MTAKLDKNVRIKDENNQLNYTNKIYPFLDDNTQFIAF